MSSEDSGLGFAEALMIQGRNHVRSGKRFRVRDRSEVEANHRKDLPSLMCRRGRRLIPPGTRPPNRLRQLRDTENAWCRRERRYERRKTQLAARAHDPGWPRAASSRAL